MQQLVQPNLGTVGRSGWCLAYAENVFNAPHIEPTAWNAWERTQFKHTDDLPDVCVPVWFDYWQDGIRYGHVAVWVPGQGVYSSPYNNYTTHAVLGSIAEVERIYDCKYVGWSEDISTLRVAIGEDNMPTPEEVRQYLSAYIVANPTQEQIDYYATRPWPVLTSFVIEKIIESLKANEQNLKAIQTALANEKAKPPKEVIKEVEKIVEKTVYVDDPETKEKLNNIQSLLNQIIEFFKGLGGK